MTDIAELGIRVRSDQADAASRSLDRLTTEAGRAERATSDFAATGDRAASVTRNLAAAAARMGAALAGAFSVAALSRATEQYTQMTNSLRVLGMTGEEAAARLQDIGAIAERTRAPLEATAQLYQRVAIASQELGASQQDVLRFTENVGLALAQQGGSAAAASGALMQLSQAIAGGTVRAEEFNAILEGAFPIAQAAARGIDAAGGSVARLRTLVIEGKVSSDEFFRAILSQTDQLEAAFANTVPTISQAFGVLTDRLILTVGAFDQALGVSGAVANAIIGLANNLDVLLVAVAALAATQLPALVAGLGAVTLGLTGAATATGALTAALALLRGGLALLGGPLGIAVGAATALAGAFFLTRQRSQEAAEGITEDFLKSIGAIPDAAWKAEIAARNAGDGFFALANNARDTASGLDEATGALARWRKEAEASGVQIGGFGAEFSLPGPGLSSTEELEGFLNTPAPSAGAASGAAIAPGASAGRSGGGGADPFRARIEALAQSIQTEREMIESWYTEAQDLLANRQAQEILGEEGHRNALLRVEQLYQEQMAALRAQAGAQQLTEAAGLFGALQGIAKAGGERLAKTAATFGAIQATINAYQAATAALATPGLGLFGRFAAYASVLAAGLQGVAAIRAAGRGVTSAAASIPSSGGGAIGSAGVAASAPVAAQETPQTVVIQGLRADQLYSGSQIFDLLYQENNSRGRVFQVIG